MKRILIALSLVTCMNIYATDSAKKDNWIKDQDDQTDTYAIPLDSSEQEEKDEERALRKEQLKKQQQKQNNKAN